jgi:hypothetical protein
MEVCYDVEYFGHEELHAQLRAVIIMCNRREVLQLGVWAGSNSGARYWEACVPRVKGQEEHALRILYRWIGSAVKDTKRPVNEEQGERWSATTKDGRASASGSMLRFA